MTLLSSKGLTLNSNKCQLKMSPLESASGISPSDVTVKAVVELSDTTNATGVRSFLALVDFTAHIISDHCQHPYANLQRMENHFCWVGKSNNRLMS